MKRFFLVVWICFWVHWLGPGPFYSSFYQILHTQRCFVAMQATPWRIEEQHHPGARCGHTGGHIQIVCWLVVWTPLKNISQLEWLFQIYGKIKVMFQSPPTSLAAVEQSLRIHETLWVATSPRPGICTQGPGEVATVQGEESLLGLRDDVLLLTMTWISRIQSEKESGPLTSKKSKLEMRKCPRTLRKNLWISHGHGATWCWDARASKANANSNVQPLQLDFGMAIFGHFGHLGIRW